MKSREILIACQDDSCASKLSDIFHGVEMVKTVSGMIRQVKNGRFQVILLDQEVEGIKSTDLVPIIKKMNPKTQIVAISSEGSLESARRLRGAGIFYQAMKPLDIDEIKYAVSCAFDKIERENLSESFFSFLLHLQNHKSFQPRTKAPRRNSNGIKCERGNLTTSGLISSR